MGDALSQSMYSARTAKVQDRLAAEGLDALFVTCLPNIYYLSGFTGSTAQLMVTRENRWFLTDFRYHTQFSEQVDPSYSLVDNTGRKFTEAVLPGLADASSLKKIGFESAHVPHAMFAQLEQAEGFEFVPTTAWVEDLRVCKDATEIELIREAVLLNERVWRAVVGKVADGMRECDLAAEIHYIGMNSGAQGVSFTPIVASGANSALPHARPTTQRLVPDTPLTFDMGMLLNGYCSDMTRTVFFKSCPEKWEKIYNIVRDAKDAATALIAPGNTCKAVDAAARDLITNAGYGDKFGHGTGHGVGREVHEAPRLAAISKDTLKPGMVVTNEPGIYLPGEGGIRIEDMYVVTESGCENLNTLGTDIEVVG